MHKPAPFERAGTGIGWAGGEQQMLAVGHVLVLNPTLLLLDEPLDGLAPILEQHPQAILKISHRTVVLNHRTVVHSDSAQELREQPESLDKLLDVAR